MSTWTQYRDQITGQLKVRAATELQNAVQSIVIETAYGPPIVIDDPLKPAPPNPFLQALKPKITLTIKGQNPLIITPYGDPGVTRWPIVKVGALVLGGLLVAGIGYGIYRAFR